MFLVGFIFTLDRGFRPALEPMVANTSELTTLYYRVVKQILVSCPINNMAFAVGQLAVFQGATPPATLRVARARIRYAKRCRPGVRAARRAYLNGYVRSEQRRKTANWPRPGGSGMKMVRRGRTARRAFRPGVARGSKSPWKLEMRSVVREPRPTMLLVPSHLHLNARAIWRLSSLISDESNATS
jgi:hypothetical protein